MTTARTAPPCPATPCSARSASPGPGPRAKVASHQQAVVPARRAHACHLGRLSGPARGALVATLARANAREQAMSELDDFRTVTLARFAEAERALHDGDPEPRLAMWSDQDPVTLFGAWGPCKSGWEQVSPGL